MDKIDIKDLLQKTFGDRFEFHPKFYEEFSELVAKSGQAKKITSVFIGNAFSITYAFVL